MARAVPVLLVTGPVGVGKSTIIADAARLLLREAGIPHAMVDLAGPQWYLDAASHLADRLEHTGVEDHPVDNHDRPVAEVLRVAGWPPARHVSPLGPRNGIAS